jgi:hypothetical protein
LQNVKIELELQLFAHLAISKPDSAGQSGDLQALSEIEDGASVEELAGNDQAIEAGIFVRLVEELGTLLYQAALSLSLRFSGAANSSK